MKRTRLDRCWDWIATLPSGLRALGIAGALILVLLAPTCVRADDAPEIKHGPIAPLPAGRTALCLHASGCIVMTPEMLQRLLDEAKASATGCRRDSTT